MFPILPTEKVKRITLVLSTVVNKPGEVGPGTLPPAQYLQQFCFAGMEFYILDTDKTLDL